MDKTRAFFFFGWTENFIREEEKVKKLQHPTGLSQNNRRETVRAKTTAKRAKKKKKKITRQGHLLRLLIRGVKHEPRENRYRDNNKQGEILISILRVLINNPFLKSFNIIFIKNKKKSKYYFFYKNFL